MDRHVLTLFVPVLFILYIPFSRSCIITPATSYVRPAHITTALETNQNVYYLGVGSNLLKEKVLNRGINGSTISVNSFGPASVDNHRLAFNMRGFLPLEPSMGGIEECEGSTCHGALMEMKASEYQKLWLSEGGGAPKPGYEEIIIDAIPYGSKKPVKAIVLRAAKHVRLTTDAPPSSRYMDIIIKGAEEIKLDPLYIENLKLIPRASVPAYLQILAKKNSLFIGFLFRQKFRVLVQGLFKICWAVYYPGYNGRPSSAFFLNRDSNRDSDNNIKLNNNNNNNNSGNNGFYKKTKEKKNVIKINKINHSVESNIVMQNIAHIRKFLSNICLSLVILPGAIIGLIIELIYKFILKKSPPGLFGRPAPPPPTVKTSEITSKTTEVTAKAA